MMYKIFAQTDPGRVRKNKQDAVAFDPDTGLCLLADGMGTMLVVDVFLEARLVLGHIGDSRCYRLRGGVLQQITKDHSVLQEQVAAGLMTAQQALASPHRNLITRALGIEGAVSVEINEHRAEPGDLYLMCSDGLGHGAGPRDRSHRESSWQLAAKSSRADPRSQRPRRTRQCLGPAGAGRRRRRRTAWPVVQNAGKIVS